MPLSDLLSVLLDDARRPAIAWQIVALALCVAVGWGLARLIHRIHDAGGFADYMYDSPPEPPLHPDDAVWAGALARSANAGDRSTPRRPAG